MLHSLGLSTTSNEVSEMVFGQSSEAALHPRFFLTKYFFSSSGKSVGEGRALPVLELQSGAHHRLLPEAEEPCGH